MLEGSVHGWVVRVRHETPVQGITKYDGKVYVGAGNDGLNLLDGATLQQLSSGIQAVKFDARGELLVSAREVVAATNDGEDFSQRIIDYFQEAVAHREPCWNYE